MKKSKILAALAAAAMAVSAFAALPASAATEYHAYLGIQSASYTFRNAWNEGTYGKGIAGPDGTNYFDHLTGWDGPTATNNGGTFTDATITADGTYTVSLTGDFDFGSDETLNLLFISTDIPLDAGVSFSNVKVKIDGNTKYTFDEGYQPSDVTDYAQIQCINIWNDDLGKADGLFGYVMPSSSVELEFTVSGIPAEAAAAAPAADSSTASAGTGNMPVAMLATVAGVAGVAAIASRKRK